MIDGSLTLFASLVPGNHDSEILEDRDSQMRAIEQMPYSLAKAGPADIDGVGNCKLSSWNRLSALIVIQT